MTRDEFLSCWKTRAGILASALVNDLDAVIAAAVAEERVASILLRQRGLRESRRMHPREGQMIISDEEMAELRRRSESDSLDGDFCVSGECGQLTRRLLDALAEARAELAVARPLVQLVLGASCCDGDDARYTLVTKKAIEAYKAAMPLQRRP